jgi:hypothetical protein
MLTERTKSEAANDLCVAAEAVGGIDDGGDIAGLSDHLARLGDALRATGGACEAAASRIVESDAAIERLRGGHHRRAAAAPLPSHERFVAALASLHVAADAARIAGRRSDQARRAVDALWRTAPDQWKP